MKHVTLYQVQHIVRAVVYADVPPARRGIGKIIVSNHVTKTLALPIPEYAAHRPSLVKDVVLDKVPTGMSKIQTLVIWPLSLCVMDIGVAILAADSLV